MKIEIFLIMKAVKQVSDCCIKQNEQFFSLFMSRTSYILWNDNDVRLALDQQA